MQVLDIWDSRRKRAHVVQMPVGNNLFNFLLKECLTWIGKISTKFPIATRRSSWNWWRIWNTSSCGGRTDGIHLLVIATIEPVPILFTKLIPIHIRDKIIALVTKYLIVSQINCANINGSFTFSCRYFLPIWHTKKQKKSLPTILFRCCAMLVERLAFSWVHQVIWKHFQWYTSFLNVSYYHSVLTMAQVIDSISRHLISKCCSIKP